MPLVVVRTRVLDIRFKCLHGVLWPALPGDPTFPSPPIAAGCVFRVPE
jgi:hypothetical protein